MLYTTSEHYISASLNSATLSPLPELPSRLRQHSRLQLVEHPEHSEAENDKC